MSVRGAGREGATREEIATELGMSPDSVRPRVVELIEGGWIAPSWKVLSSRAEETRRTRLGNEAEVLVVTEAALSELIAGRWAS